MKVNEFGKSNTKKFRQIPLLALFCKSISSWGKGHLDIFHGAWSHTKSPRTNSGTVFECSAWCKYSGLKMKSNYRKIAFLFSCLCSCPGESNQHKEIGTIFYFTS